jgi:tRNA (Thr-GGU) A37 N-methylase
MVDGFTEKEDGVFCEAKGLEAINGSPIVDIKAAIECRGDG